MSGYYEGNTVKIEAGQIMNPDSFPRPNELVCVEIPKVFDQVALRACVTRDIALSTCADLCHPEFSFEGTGNFVILEVKIISKTDSLTKPGCKKIRLSVKVGYDVFYSDGVSKLTQFDEAVFNLAVNELYCPDCFVRTGVACCSNVGSDASSGTADKNKSNIKVELLPEVLRDNICTCTGALSLDIGAFFIVKCEGIVQLLIPAFGYCPVPAEQSNPAAQNCVIFNNRNLTPFPESFFPDQKWNPLDY